MPILPAKAEKIAPIINATTIKICVDGTIKDTPAKTILAAKTNIASNLYSAFRNASAP